MDFGMQTMLVKQLFANAAIKAGGSAGFLASLDVDGSLFATESGNGANAVQRGEFRQLIATVAADGVLTDGELGQILTFLEKQGLHLSLPSYADPRVDLDNINLPDF